MLLTEVRIRRLKSIESLDLTLSDQVTMLYGPNGIGKSSVLEVASLLGHLSVLPELLFKDGSFQAGTKYDSATTASLLSALRDGGAGSRSLEDWFTSRSAGSVASFSVKHLEIDGGREFKIYLYINTPDDLTSLLSRVHHEGDLAKAIAIVVDTSSANSVRQFVELLRRGRANPRENGGIVVSYINTDLNDFGHGNDLRESPKNLTADFVHEMKDRLQLDFSGPPKGDFTAKKKLNDILKRTLTYSNLYVPGMSEQETAFEIVDCRIDPETNKLRFSAKRLASNYETTPLKFMSAGENECFFVFALLLGLPLQKGLILLDEPDLHLSAHQKRTFFKELYATINSIGCQAIVATHSEYALVGFNRIAYRVIRPTVGSNYEFELVADEGVNLPLAHSKMFLGRAAKSLWCVAPFSKQLLVSTGRNFSTLKSQVLFWVTVLTILIYASLVMVSSISDILMTWFGQTKEEHQVFVQKLLGYQIPAGVTALAFILWAVGINYFKRRKQRDRIRKAIARKELARSRNLPYEP